MTLYDKYINDVTEGKIVVCEYVRLAVQRHVSDLAKSKAKDYPFTFDRVEADRVLGFIGFLKHTAGSFQNKPFNIQPYQAFGIACIFGWKNKETGFRRFTKVYWDTGRKSGKSELLGAIGVYTLGWDNEGAPQNYCVATTRDQAAYVYNAAHYMARKLIADSDSAAARLKIVQYHIKDTENNGFIRCLTADAETNDGANPHFASIDEYHAHNDDSMLKVVETGMGGRDQPLLWITTTAGFNKNGPCYSFRDMVIKVLRGQLNNDGLFGYIFSLDEKDDPHDENNWIKSNPNIGNTPKWDWMRTKHKEAMAEGGETLVQFLTKNLNIWTDAASVWIEDGIYMKCAIGRREDLHGKECYVGVDLASENDLTAVNYFVSGSGWH
ncbi:MAG: terminase large subunit [Saprospiraceae bacterium]|nr:terminase large subunit [Saprospiraceae bacterium]